MAQLSKLTGHGKQAMFNSNCVPSSCADPARRPSAELADSESMLKLLQVELVVLTMPKGSFCD